MAKHPVPKKRVSLHKRRQRRSHHALTLPTLAECDHCRQLKLPHVVCPHCGYYGGSAVLETAG
ncbi:MAG: 50S ribosomal protein L32 [Deinococcus sp.]|nr:50S ribosomal protein L32 [Deinococcus sp.]